MSYYNVRGSIIGIWYWDKRDNWNTWRNTCIVKPGNTIYNKHTLKLREINEKRVKTENESKTSVRIYISDCQNNKNNASKIHCQFSLFPFGNTENVHERGSPQEISKLRRSLRIFKIIGGRVCVSPFIRCYHHPWILCQTFHPLLHPAIVLCAPVVTSTYTSINHMLNQNPQIKCKH